MTMIILQDALFFALLVGMSIPLGRYMVRVMSGEPVALARVMGPVEKFFYRTLGRRGTEDMSAKQYAVAILVFSAIGFIVLFAIQAAQGILPFNPEKFAGVSWDLAFNTAASFVSNTNWQAYSGETTMSYLTQCVGLTVQNFASAATGIAVLFALTRGFAGKQQSTLGNFWVDLTRSILYVLLPLSVIVAIVLVTQGVVQTFAGAAAGTSLEGGAALTVPLGPAASQIAIKQLGTNGGGFFGANSAFPARESDAAFEPDSDPLHSPDTGEPLRIVRSRGQGPGDRDGRCTPSCSCCSSPRSSA